MRDITPQDTTDDLLLRAAEEATEVGKEACKAIRFGLTSFNPYEPDQGDNMKRLLTEHSQLTALVEEIHRRYEGMTK